MKCGRFMMKVLQIVQLVVEGTIQSAKPNYGLRFAGHIS